MRISDWSSDVCSSDLHVADGDDREREAVGSAGIGIDVLRSGAAEAAAEDVGANDEETVGVERQARPDDQLPPARLAGDRVRFGGELVAGQGMADEDRIRLVRVPPAIGLVRARERSYESRVGNECVSTCRTCWSPCYKKKK